MRRQATNGLEVCLLCEEKCVSLVDCTRTREGKWWLRLRCGSCGAWHETFAPDDAVAALQRSIRRGHGRVAETVRNIELERMASEIERFSRALELDLIGPEDFRHAG